MFEEMLALLETLPATSKSANDDLRRHIIANCLFGMDVATEAVRACRLRLARTAGDAHRPVRPLDLSRRIVCGDSLLGPAQDAAFDIVLANPPYVSFGLRGNPAARKAWAAAIRQQYPRSAEYKLSTYAVFVDRCLSLTRPGGVCCCITPDSYLLGRHFAKLRRRILADCAIRALFLIEEDFWKGAVVGRPVIGVFRPGGPSGDVTTVRARSLADLTAGRIESYAYPQAYFAGLPRSRFRLLFSAEDRRFVEAMERAAGRLGDVVSFASGLIGRHGRAAIVADSSRGPTWRRGIDSGGDVLPYRVRYRGKYLNFAADVLKSGFRDARYDEPKLLLRQTGDRLIAAYDPDGLYCLNNVHVGNARDESVDVRLIVALLNSDLLNRYYRIISLEAGRALAQVDIDVLEDLPFKRPSAADERELLAVVGQLHGGAANTESTDRLERLVENAYFC